MTRRLLISILVSFSVLVVTATAYSQPMKGWRGSGGWGPDSQYNTMYNQATVETVTGEVISVERITPIKGMHYGIHLQLKTERETLSVHLGPGWYIERLDAKIEKGDRIEAKGSRVTFNNTPSLIAAEITKGDSLLILRDADGFPVWSGWRR